MAASLKSLVYVSSFVSLGYILMKVTERDSEEIRKQLPEGQQVDYHNESQRRKAAFMQVLKNAAEGDDPEVAIRKAKLTLATIDSTPTPPPPISSQSS
ncbi:hypothetical protein Pmani_011850 [Petrolisthes manimaculis]|uniref:Ubiquinol-cytochrome-c reductase complex assembly factor 3 n=1 Tax=Petrolisthes manimaculis TaxID=1843537 RepID=A0AAE1PZ68_9EUCA|nr:hypothetical protein Pmani_011850 [Petrolisthes manimaculis]